MIRTGAIAYRLAALFFLALPVLTGCVLGIKEWPQPVKAEDVFTLEVMAAKRTDTCLLLTLSVGGSVERLYRASIQYEAVGDSDGQGCEGCPFVPRKAEHFTRDQNAFELHGATLKLSLCGLNPQTRYRFRVAGKNDLSVLPMVYTEVFVTTE
ncbi:hypothetical protein GKC30_11470 [Pseudodesulfovibrio sp. F-1]|uniref:Lipoprotein n=1 Tax=Pseudodesulfovibrio alkaliphilus TaxID=2661613 RepID=A0A7K1KQ80_9BACT|nr:hypothetical protein [Pseudodesulfovibrio alkaliphilus]MUM78256.1 hypothetical protein [Pseudodesulfovibrio alkaliphilus]